MHKRGWAAFAHAIKTGIQRRAVLRGSAAVLAGAVLPTAVASASPAQTAGDSDPSAGSQAAPTRVMPRDTATRRAMGTTTRAYAAEAAARDADVRRGASAPASPGRSRAVSSPPVARNRFSAVTDKDSG